MSSLTLDPKNLFHETRELEEQGVETRGPKAWYRSTSSRKNRLYPLFNWAQLVFSGLRGDEFQIEDEATPSSMERPVVVGYGIEEVDSVLSRRFAELPHPDVKEFSQFIQSIDSIMSSRDQWTRIFAYTDFGSMPIYASILALAATVGEKQFSARRVSAERFRSRLRERGITEAILDCVGDDSSVESDVRRYIDAAHMVACLEGQVATVGYLNAAIQFEKIDDIRSALACVYRNARYRLRNNQLAELNDELETFDVGAAGIDTMLAVLTATAPAKSRLASRKRLFRQVKAELKKRGQLDKGLLDGLK